MSNGLIGMPSSDYETQIKELGGILQDNSTMSGLTPQQIRDMVMQATPSGVLPSSGTSGGLLDTILGGLGQIGSAVTPAIPAIAGTLLTGEAYERLSDVGREAQREALALAERGQAESQFRPFTVTTATGGQFGTT
jgi:hypothetical protein